MFNFFKPAAVPPVPLGATFPHPSAAEMASARLAVSKAVTQIKRLADTYMLDFRSSENLPPLLNDLAHMLAYGDLVSIAYQIMDPNECVVLESSIAFNKGGRSGFIQDTAQGVEIPVLKAGRAASGRFIITNSARNDELLPKYARHLVLSWSTAKKLNKSSGAAFTSQHCAKITGGRQNCTLHIDDKDRRVFTLKRTGSKGFGFAEAKEGGETVFVVQKELPGEVPFRVGASFSAVLVQTPRGLQAWGVQAIQTPASFRPASGGVRP